MPMALDGEGGTRMKHDDEPPASVFGRHASGATIIAGLAGGAAFIAVLEADLRLTRRNVDDLLILGRPFARDPARARRIGAIIHAANSVALAALYARLESHLPGPPWLKGALFANVENVILYPISLFEDLHPAIRDGQVDRYLTWPAFWQSVPRHIAYGAVLGTVYDRLRQVGRSSPGGICRLRVGRWAWARSPSRSSAGRSVSPPSAPPSR